MKNKQGKQLILLGKAIYIKDSLQRPFSRGKVFKQIVKLSEWFLKVSEDRGSAKWTLFANFQVTMKGEWKKMRMN